MLSCERGGNTPVTNLKTKIMRYLLFTVALFAAQHTATAQAPKSWQPNTKYIAANTVRDTTVKKYQCYGTTLAGTRCKRKVATANGFCYQHSKQQQ